MFPHFVENKDDCIDEWEYGKHNASLWANVDVIIIQNGQSCSKQTQDYQSFRNVIVILLVGLYKAHHSETQCD